MILRRRTLVRLPGEGDGPPMEAEFENGEISYSMRLIFRDYPRPHCFWIWFDGNQNHHPIYRNWHVPNW